MIGGSWERISPAYDDAAMKALEFSWEDPSEMTRTMTEEAARLFSGKILSPNNAMIHAGRYGF